MSRSSAPFTLGSSHGSRHGSRHPRVVIGVLGTSRAGATCSRPAARCGDGPCSCTARRCCPQHCAQGCTQQIGRNSQAYPLPSHRAALLYWAAVPLTVRYAAKQNVRRPPRPPGVLGAGQQIRDPEPAISHRRAAGSTPDRVRVRAPFTRRASQTRCSKPCNATVSPIRLDGAELQCCNFKSGIYHYRLWLTVRTGDLHNNI